MDVAHDTPSLTDSSQSSGVATHIAGVDPGAQGKSLKDLLGYSLRVEGNNRKNHLNTEDEPEIVQQLKQFLRIQACGSPCNEKKQQSRAEDHRHVEAKHLSLNGVVDIMLSACDPPTDAEGRELYQAFSGGDMSVSSSQELERQIRRLTSWNTVGTTETLGTGFSDASLTDYDAFPQYDDDGNAINRARLNAMKHRGPPRRRRLVRFDYPHVSSLRECPRPDPATLGELYFTEAELDQMEDDRECTFTADDVEVVAVASSCSTNSDNRQPSSTSIPSTTSADTGIISREESIGDGSFPHYLSTPSRRKNFFFEEMPGRGRQLVVGQRSRKQRRFPTPGPGSRKQNKTHSPEEEQKVAPPTPKAEEQSPEESQRKGRLIKSVQIYLRERSSG